MGRVLAALRAVLVDLKAFLQGLLVLVGTVVELFAGRALELDEVILRHKWGKVGRRLRKKLKVVK